MFRAPCHASHLFLRPTLMATCLALSLSAEAELFKLHLPAQSLATSLSQVAQQAKIQLLFDETLLKNVQAPALDGDYTPEVGDVVSFEYGRKENRALQGKVLGVKDTGKGVIVTVFVDDGANSELCKVFSTHCRKLEDEGAFEEAEVVEPAEAADPFAL